MTEKWIVMVGNVSDGFKAVGPFETLEEAEQWQGRRAEYWTICDTYSIRITDPATTTPESFPEEAD